MIQLMYLVLTAMLALNITKEVLDAFSTINDSIETSNVGIFDKNQRMYAAFEKVGDKDPDQKKKAIPYLEKAKIVKAESDKLFQYLGTWKDTVIERSGGYTTPADGGEKRIKVIDNIDVASKLFIEEGKGKSIKKEMEDYVQKMLALIDDPTLKSDVAKNLPLKFLQIKKTDANPSADWSFGTFHNIPVVAAVTLFSKYQSDVRNTEALVIETLMGQVSNDVDLEVFKVDAFMAVATPNTSYALPGDEITANIALAAYNKSSNPTMTSSAGSVQVQDGVGTLKFRAGAGTGVQTVSGKITINTHGKVETKDWKFNYTVGTAGASLQLDKMNVMYLGVDNPITISAAGYDLNDVQLNMPGVSITKASAGKYIVRPSAAAGGNTGVDYTIMAKNKSGAQVKVGGGKMRIKVMPPPTIFFKDISGSGRMATAIAKAQMGLLPKLENVDFEFKYLITSYKLEKITKGSDEIEQATGNSNFDGDVRRLMDRSRPGDTWIFSNIKAKGPDGLDKPAKGSITIFLN